MLTELLERAVIQLCKDDSIPYEITPDGRVEIHIELTGAMIPFIIIDVEEMGVLTILVPRFVKFSKDRVAYATTMCNELNLMELGEFHIHDGRFVSYTLHFPTNETTGPSEFHAAFKRAINFMGTLHPVFMKVRWAKATVDQALESDDGTPGEYPLIHNELIKEALRLIRQDEKPGLSNEELEKLWGQIGQEEIDWDIDPEG